MINHGWKKTGIKLSPYSSWLVTFFAVIFAWVFFRAQSFSDATSIIKAMLGYDHAFSLQSQLSNPLMMVICIGILIYWSVAVPNTQQIIISRQPRLRLSILISLMLVLGILGLGPNDNFIYFRF